MGICLVTGVAGFIGSHLAEELIACGHEVIGVDCFTTYYTPEQKRRNLVPLLRLRPFRFIEADVLHLDRKELPSAIDCVFHLAGQPGVRSSWGPGFETYLRQNVASTQCLLDLAVAVHASRFVLASSSSVYGGCIGELLRERDTLRPLSPYGVSKQAAEQLCRAYAEEFRVPVAVLRYFSVYGPRQRPDMAFQRFFAAAGHRPITLLGSAKQSRDYTFVGDIVRATVASYDLASPMETFNIASGRSYSLEQVMEAIASVTGKVLDVVHSDRQAGDPFATAADISWARSLLKYEPSTSLLRGLQLQWEWNLEQLHD
jgi:UDP-glucuronate 4-epimerase